jgi:maltose O-acetyltransferase
MEEFCASAIVGTDLSLAPTFSFRIVGAKDPHTVAVGNNVALDGMLVSRSGGRIRIGSHCSFRTSTFIGALEAVEIGDYVYGVEGVFICDNNNHPTSPRQRREMCLSEPGSPPWKWDGWPGIGRAPISIEECVWLGRFSTVLKGVTIGRGSIVAAGAVVVKSVPPFSIVAGNPARVVKVLENDLD